jgi:HEPN domain-containing protein
MLPDPPAPGTPQDWLARARSNLVRSRQPKPQEVLWEDLCFDTQQAAEKALKAVLLSRAVSFPRVHNIAALLTLVQKQGIAVPSAVMAASQLTDYAVMARYPGPSEPVTEEEYRAALATAEAVYLWASTLIGVRG